MVDVEAFEFEDLDLDEFNFTDEEKDRWNSLATYLNDVGPFALKRLGLNFEPTFSNITTAENRDLLFTIFEKISDFKGGNHSRNLIDILPEIGEKLDNSQQKQLFEYISTKELKEIASMKKPIKSILSHVPQEDYSIVLNNIHDLNNNNDKTASIYLKSVGNLYANLSSDQNEILYSIGKSIVENDVVVVDDDGKVIATKTGEFFKESEKTFKEIVPDSTDIIQKAEKKVSEFEKAKAEINDLKELQKEKSKLQKDVGKELEKALSSYKGLVSDDVDQLIEQTQEILSTSVDDAISFTSVKTSELKEKASPNAHDILQQTQAYSLDSADVVVSFMKSARSAYKELDKNHIKQWIDTGNQFSLEDLRSGFFETSHSVLKEVDNKETLLSIVKDMTSENEQMALGLFKSGKFVVDQADSDIVQSWINIGKQHTNALSYVDHSRNILSHVDENSLAQWGKVSLAISNKDYDASNVFLKSSKNLISSLEENELSQIYSHISQSMSHSRDAIIHIVQDFKTMSEASSKSLGEWLNVGDRFVEGISEKYYEESSPLIDQLHRHFIDDWVDTANIFTDTSDVAEYFKSSAENFKFLADKDGALAFELTRQLAKNNSHMAKDFYDKLPSFYSEEKVSEEKIRQWVSFGQSLNATRGDSPEFQSSSFFKYTSGVTKLLSKEELGQWQSVFSTFENAKDFMESSVETLESVDSTHRSKMLDTIKDLAEKNESAFSSLSGKEGYLVQTVPHLDAYTLEHINSVAAAIYDIEQPGVRNSAIHTLSNISIDNYDKIPYKEAIFDQTVDIAQKGNINLALGIIEEGNVLRHLSKEEAQKYIEKAAYLHIDVSRTDEQGNALTMPWYERPAQDSGSNTERFLSPESYGIFLSSAPILAKLPEQTQETIMEDYQKVNTANRREEHIKSLHSFLTKTDPRRIPYLSLYNHHIMSQNWDAGVKDLEVLPELAKMPEIAQQMIMEVGMLISEQEPGSISGYLGETLESMETIKPQDYKYVYSAEKTLMAENALLAASFLRHFSRITGEFSSGILTDFAKRGIDIYREQGLEAADTFFKIGLTREFIKELKAAHKFIEIDDFRGPASTWGGGFYNEPFAIGVADNGEIAYTDKETIYLPARIDKFESSERNQNLYWGLMDHELGHIIYGSFEADISEVIKEYDKPLLARHIINVVEDGRIEYNLTKQFGKLIKKELDLVNNTYVMLPLNENPAASNGDLFMSALLQQIKVGKHVTEIDEQYNDALEQCYSIYLEDAKKSDVFGTLSASQKIYDIVQDLFPDMNNAQNQAPGGQIGDYEESNDQSQSQQGNGSGQGQQQQSETMAGNHQENNDQNQSQQGGGSGQDQNQQILQQSGNGSSNGEGDNSSAVSAGEGGSGDDNSSSPEKQSEDNNNDPNGENAENNNGNQVMGKLNGQDEGDGEENTGKQDNDMTSYSPEMPTDKNEIIKQYKFDEWDSKLQDYLYKWTTVNETIREAASTAFYEETVKEQSKMKDELISLMEELKPVQVKKMKRLDNGAEIDMDAYIDAWGEKKSGAQEMDEHIFENNEKYSRDTAVFILIDQSGSTGSEGIIYREKQAVALISDALEELGDQFSIYGFDSHGKDNVSVYRVKSFDEDYSDVTKGRIEAMQPGCATRMGPAMRFGMDQLNEVSAERKIFLYLSDGEPNDYGDSPHASVGEYVMDDIRQVIKEGEEQGVHSYCFSLVENTNEYLDKLFGKGNYGILTDIEELPKELGSFYREITG